MIFALTIITFFLLYFGPYRNPGWLSPGFAGALLLFGLAAFSTGEFIREAVRKPYIIYNVVLGNQILPEEVPQLRKQGYLESGVWTKAYVSKYYPEASREGVIQGKPPLGFAQAAIASGWAKCCSNITATIAMPPAWVIRPPARCCEAVRANKFASLIDHLDTYIFMPPWAGTNEEAELLTDYLMSIAPPRPDGMRLGSR